MKKLLFSIALIVCAMFFSGCTLTKHLVYFQNIDTVNLAQGEMRPKIKIKPNDELTINVTSITPEAAAPFNFNANSVNAGSYMGSTGSIYTYIVDKDGEINFPVLGKIKVEGKTRPELEDYICEQIQPYFSEQEKPVVKVRISNFKVIVIGAAGPSVINVPNERMSIIEALAKSGDISLYGKKTNIMLIREDAKGEKMTARYNINDANILNSPYYFLEQNDIIYVEPHKIQARNADISANTFWTSLTSLGMSLATMVVAITKW